MREATLPRAAETRGGSEATLPRANDSAASKATLAGDSALGDATLSVVNDSAVDDSTLPVAGGTSAAAATRRQSHGAQGRGGVPRVLVGGVGYRNLRDMSAGPELIERLRALDWPSGVEVEDLSFGAVHVLHWLQERPPFDALVLVAAVARGRAPGSVTRLEWTTPPMTGEAVQEAIAEAVTGVLSLDTLLTVLGYFVALPPRVVLIEVEPRDDDWGPEFSLGVQSALDESVHLVACEVQALLK